MREVLLVLGLVFLIPVFSAKDYGDCDENCQTCDRRSFVKCIQCKKNYAIREIYIRRRCVKSTSCYHYGSVWDPVLQSDICDKVVDRGDGVPNCEKRTSRGSCLKCQSGFALKMKWIGYNVCDKNCKKCKDPRSQVKLCKPVCDCDENCQTCDRSSPMDKCIQCKKNYAITKIYERRLCVKSASCHNGSVWDPVLQSDICDNIKKIAKGGGYGLPNCEKHTSSGSCLKCQSGFALKMKMIGYNVCDKDCKKCKDPRSQQVEVCKSDDCDCDENCQTCDGSHFLDRCIQCKENYAIRKIYSRRLCVKSSSCYNGPVWDPVLQSDICDKVVRSRKSDVSNCKKRSFGGSCIECKRGFALRMRTSIFRSHAKMIGYNECDKDCVKCRDPRTQVKVCKPANGPCPGANTTSASPAPVTNPTHGTGSTPEPSPEPFSEPTSGDKKATAESTPSPKSTNPTIFTEPNEENGDGDEDDFDDGDGDHDDD